jgi:hypothetical protein
MFLLDSCLKIRPGKFGEFETWVRDGDAKLAQVQIDEGRILFWAALRARVPTGSEMRCDVHILEGSSVYPLDETKGAGLAAGLQKAGLKLTPDGFREKRNSLATVVNTELWRVVGSAGASMGKGSFVQLNYRKIKAPTLASEWVRYGNEGYRPFAEEMAKRVPGMGWLAAVLVMPRGSLSLNYNASTLDIIPDRAALRRRFAGNDPLMAEVWSKVHPDRTNAEYVTGRRKLDDEYRTEIFQVMEAARVK